MNDYQSLYSWAMERQSELRAEAEMRRLVRRARRRGSLPTEPHAGARLLVLRGAADEAESLKSA
ncbi:MAG TPA: hypothetical protein VET65_01095 [Candidatus Limnocylindrales bacterium]|nr:hypothetical protein [Candidatus Limnocylindrales bacterium]